LKFEELQINQLKKMKKASTHRGTSSSFTGNSTAAYLLMTQALKQQNENQRSSSNQSK
jgi:hypothetical protein